MLKEPLTLEKLYQAITNMAMNKVPDKDGALVEFYLTV